MSATMMDYLARAVFAKAEIKDADIKIDEKGEPVVYKRRWAILATYCLSYFFWSISTLRYVPLIAEFAIFFDTTNDFQSFDELGVDFLSILGSFLLIIYYPLIGSLIDNYGLKMMNVGAVGLAVCAWWWYLAGRNFTSVIICKTFLQFFGALMSASLLRLTNNWFAEKQRPFAVATAAICSNFGGGFALLYGPVFFTTGEDQINLDIKSCKDEFKESFNATESGTECFEDAEDDFCCFAETDIDGMNFSIGVLATLICIFSLITVRDSPPTPPSNAGKVRKGPSIKKGLSLMFSHKNYVVLCIADFLCSGPPLVVFSTIDRIFPPSVSDYSTVAAAIGLILAIPVAVLVARILAKKKNFYEMTTLGYTTGCTCFVLVAIMIMIGTDLADVMVVVLAIFGLLCYMVWTVSVYELKMEYVFSAEFAIQGYVVSMHRTVINMASMSYLLAIPPERFDGDKVDGRQFSFLVGSLSIVIGTLMVIFLPNKREYLREKYERETDHVIDELLDEDLEYKKKQSLIPVDAEASDVAFAEAQEIENKDAKIADAVVAEDDESVKGEEEKDPLEKDL